MKGDKSMNIQDKVMLVNLSISQWTARKFDKKASDAVADMFNAAHDQLKTSKSIIAKKHLNEITQTVHDTRTYHYKHTLPYDNAGAAILTTAVFPEYMAEISKLKTRFENAVNELIANYSGYVEEQKQEYTALGKLFNPSEYPNVDDLQRKYKMSVEFAPLPVGDNFKVMLDADTLKDIQADIEEKAAKSIETAMADLWQRAYKTISALKERMSDTGDKQKIFRDTIIGNIGELADLLPKLNITNDTDLNDLADVLKKDLAGLIPDELRQDKAKRADAVKKADEILARLNNRGVVQIETEPEEKHEIAEPEKTKTETKETGADITAKLAAAGII